MENKAEERKNQLGLRGREVGVPFSRIRVKIVVGKCSDFYGNIVWKGGSGGKSQERLYRGHGPDAELGRELAGGDGKERCSRQLVFMSKGVGGRENCKGVVVTAVCPKM